MAKYLFFTDPHIHERAEFAVVGSNGLNSRLEEGLSILEQIADLANEEQVDHVFCLGDIFEMKDRIPAHMLDIVSYIFQEQFIAPMTILRGNHDFKLEEYPIIQALFRGSDKVSFINEPTTFNDHGFRIELIPYYRDFNQFLLYFNNANDTNPDIIMFHQEVPGVSYGGKVFDPGKKMGYKENILYISGHIHETQRVGQTFYLGSPYQTSFNEEGQGKYVYIFDTNVRLSRAVQLKYSEFVTLDVDQNEIDIPSNSYVRIVGELAKSKLPDLEKSIELIKNTMNPKVLLNQVKVKKLKRRTIMSKQTDHEGVLRDFVTINKNDSFNKERLIQTGLKFLGGE